MKQLDSGLQAHLDEGTTTLCFCWSVTRRDGTTQGFTNHDEPVTFGGVTYEASSGFDASEIETSLGLAVDNLNAIGALSSDSINEDDLAAGLYNGATVALWRVNWANVSQRAELLTGTIGEVTRRKTSFSAEVRSLSQSLNAATGRVYQLPCDADLGDAKCSPAGEVDLTSATYAKAGAVVAVLEDKRTFTMSGTATGFTDGYCSLGHLVWATGNNAGLVCEVRVHSVIGSIYSVELWQLTPYAIAPGDTFTLKAGCDKRRDTCRDKFSNLNNHRGFAYMPGNDVVTRYVQKGGKLDGGSLYGN